MLGWLRARARRAKALRIVLQPQDVRVLRGDSALLRCAAVGGLPGEVLVYEWQLQGSTCRARSAAQDGVDAHEHEVLDAGAEVEGVYTCAVYCESSGASLASRPATLTVLDAVEIVARPAFAYSPSVQSFHARRDRVAPLPPCRLYGAAMRTVPPLGLGVRLTLPCGWNNAGHQQI